MSLFSKFRRSSTVADRKSESSVYPRSTRPRHVRHHRQQYDTEDTVSHAVSVESIPYLPSESTRGASSEVSLRSEYTHLDNDTSRYPKWSTATSTGSAPSTTHRRRGRETQDELASNGRRVESQVASILTFGTLSFTWDVRDPPPHTWPYRNPRYADDILAPALSTQAKYLCIVSHDFPWTVAISTNDGRPLTVIDVLEALYESLMKEVRRSEWALATDMQKYITLKANKDRRRTDVAMRIRRVDWLGARCMFRGLIRDSELFKRRLMPGDRIGEMWAVRFGSMH